MSTSKGEVMFGCTHKVANSEPFATGKTLRKAHLNFQEEAQMEFDVKDCVFFELKPIKVTLAIKQEKRK